MIILDTHIWLWCVNSEAAELGANTYRILLTPTGDNFSGTGESVNIFLLDVIPNRHKSLVTASGIHRIDSSEGVIKEVYTSRYWPGDTLGDHLEFALKYDGTNLAILGILFQKAGDEDLLSPLRMSEASRPGRPYGRPDRSQRAHKHPPPEK